MWYAKAGEAGAGGVVSENASVVSPHEKTIKESASSRRMERGVVRKTEELSPSDGRKKKRKNQKA